MRKCDLLSLVGNVYCIFVTFPRGNLGQVWYLIVSFPDICLLSCLVWFSLEINEIILLCMSCSVI